MNQRARREPTLRTATLVLVLFAHAALGEDNGAGEAARTGEFKLTFTLAEVAGEASAADVASVIAPDEPVTWEIYVPDSYQPEDPAGLIVYISPSPSGKIPRDWKRVMDRRNLVWIAADGSGNRVEPARRALYALVAPTLAGKHYAIDGDRVYLSGLSGGGKMAGMVAADYPQLFKGAIYNCGVEPWDRHPPGQFELFKQNRFVFVTGTRDQARQQTVRVHQQYLESGIENSKLMVIRNMTHRNPDGSDFEAAIQYLDSRIGPEDPVERSH